MNKGESRVSFCYRLPERGGGGGGGVDIALLHPETIQ